MTTTTMMMMAMGQSWTIHKATMTFRHHCTPIPCLIIRLNPPCITPLVCTAFLRQNTDRQSDHSCRDIASCELILGEWQVQLSMYGHNSYSHHH